MAVRKTEKGDITTSSQAQKRPENHQPQPPDADKQSAANQPKPTRKACTPGESRFSSRKKHAHFTIACLALILVATVSVSLVLGRYPIEPWQAFLMCVDKVFPIDASWTDRQEAMFFNVRFPRIVLAVLVGCCLSAAGAAFQGTFQNPLVSPDILGASQGAAFGAAVAILMGFSSAMVSASAFCFSMLTIALVLIISSRAKGNRVLVVVLAGVMVSSLFSAGVSYTKLIADPANELADITYWLMGSITGARFETMLPVIPIMAAGLIVLFALRWRINILTMGDDEALTMGVNVKRIRLIVIIAATLVTASSVALTGMIGWVGLVIPHLSRMLVGCDYRTLLPTSMLMGASFLLIVDDFSRLLTTAEIPIGILTAFIGAPFFLYLITRKKKA